MIQFLEQAPRRPFNFSSANRTHPASSPPPPCSPFYSPTECCAYRDTSDSESLQECDKNMTPPVPTNLSIDPSILANPHFSSFSADNVSREIRGSRYNRPFVPKIYIYKSKTVCTYIFHETIEEESLIYHCFRRRNVDQMRPQPSARLQREILARTILETDSDKGFGIRVSRYCSRADWSWNYQGQ